MSISTTPNFLLAIDPGASAGWALFEEGKLTAYGTARGSMWRSFVQDMAPKLKNWYQNGTAIIEQGWTNRSKSALTLGQRRGLAQAAAEFFGFDQIEYIASSTWMNGLYGSIHGKDTKRLSTERVRTVHNLVDLTHDVCDAINIGEYFLQNCKTGLKNAKKKR
jgi:Holliday junction resolvasome RuvABC endonuclease subunit